MSCCYSFEGNFMLILNMLLKNVIHAAEVTKECFLNHNIALFFNTLHALMTRIRWRISGDGRQEISAEIEASSKLLTSLEKQSTPSGPRILLTFQKRLRPVHQNIFFTLLTRMVTVLTHAIVYRSLVTLCASCVQFF